MVELMKTESVLERSMCSLLMVLMSLCDSDMRNQVESSIEFPNLEKENGLHGAIEPEFM